MPESGDLGPGLRRRIVIATRRDETGGEARAAVEDDFHHFRVAIRHREGAICDARGEALRNPYTACPMAAGELARLIGAQLYSSSTQIFRATDARLHCTHMLDLAGIASAAAAQNIERRVYDMAVPDRREGLTRPTLARDGAAILAWDADPVQLLGPAPFTGVDYRHGFAEWARSNLTEDEAEAALVLRRALAISVGRTKPLDAQIHAEPTGNCFAQQPVRADAALRVRGSIRDFSPNGESLCSEDADWLQFGGKYS